MTPDQRAALERLLEYVGRGFCAVQADCKVLREYLKTLPAASALDVLGDVDRDALIYSLRSRLNAIERTNARFINLTRPKTPQTKKPTPKPRKR